MQRFEALLSNRLAKLREWFLRLPWSAMRDRLRQISAPQSRARLAGLGATPLLKRLGQARGAVHARKLRELPRAAGRSIRSLVGLLRDGIAQASWADRVRKLRELARAQGEAIVGVVRALRGRIARVRWADHAATAGGLLGTLRDRCVALLRRLPQLAARLSPYTRLMRWHQPIGIWLLLWPTLWGLWIAGEGLPDERVLIVFVLGTIVLRSAGCIINDFADRKIDPLVARTADRPLAAGEVKSSEALVLFAGLMLVGLGLVLTLNSLTVQLAIVGAAIAVVYPFTKRVIATPQFVLGIAFAWGVPMAFAAQVGTVPRLGWLLFLAAVIWGVVYDTQYAMADREDDLKAGVRSTATLFGELDRTLVGGLQLLLLLALLLAGAGAGLGAWYYGGIVLAASVAIYQQYLIRDRDPERCLRAFRTNAWLGGWVFTGILLDYLFR